MRSGWTSGVLALPGLPAGDGRCGRDDLCWTEEAEGARRYGRTARVAARAGRGADDQQARGPRRRALSVVR